MTKRTKGKITHWNEQKGYGFITPSAGAKQVFVHIRAFNNRQEPPRLNQIVSFSLSTDKQGRPCAVSVTRVGEKQPRGIQHNGGKNHARGGVLGKLTSSKWAKIANCSQDTAGRDIKGLITLGALRKDPGGGRSASYSVVYDFV